jgi:hypothetical protein
VCCSYNDVTTALRHCDHLCTLMSYQQEQVRFCCCLVAAVWRLLGSVSALIQLMNAVYSSWRSRCLHRVTGRRRLFLLSNCGALQIKNTYPLRVALIEHVFVRVVSQNLLLSCPLASSLSIF